MKNVNLFPIVVPGYVYEDGSSEPSYVESGATLLDFFACNAPDVPYWFEPNVEKPVTKWPARPESWPDIFRHNAGEFTNANDIIDWVKDMNPGIEISPELKESLEEYYEMCEKVSITRDNRNLEYEVAREVQWRWHYAVEMMKARPDEA